MPELTPEIAPQLKALYDTSGVAISESLNQCFDEVWTLEFGEPAQVDLGHLGSDGGAEGLIVYMTVGERNLLVALPKSLPLPDWIRQPNMSQSSRMETLAMEWSMNCLPEDLPCDQFGTVLVRTLQEGLEQCGLMPGTMWIPVTAVSPKGTARFHILLTSEKVPVAQPMTEEVPEPPVATATTQGPPPPSTNGDGGRLRRLLKLPVHVVVKLAEKRIPLGQFLSLSPGAIVNFDKSCEDLLDLYVNNSLYARGEAVKIGEKFGLKVNEVGSVNHRASAILHSHH